MIKLIKSSLVDALRVVCATLCLLYLIVVGYQLITGRSAISFADQLRTQTATAGTAATCSSQAPLALHNTANPQLRRLWAYQQACRSYVTATMMTFIGIPASDAHAAAEATQVATTLKAFAANHVRPLVIAEPTDYMTGRQLDVGEFAKGAYTSSLSAMFGDLQHIGIRSSEMGIWNPFPEANLPEWSDNQPQYFAPSVNIFVSSLERHFPGTPTSIMLDAESYQPDDTGFRHGQYASLLPYVQGITPGTIDYVGIQGFPWLPQRYQPGAMLDPATFLAPSLLSTTASYLGTRHVWLNTGTFSAQYTQDPDHTVQLSPAQRQIILSGIDRQALGLQQQGYDVAVNLFAQDKSGYSEATDWAYWNDNDPSDSTATPVFTGFVRSLNQQGIGFWLFDQ